jgi:2',3'-cyclic-nucleotide 2'-phosphodiesterase (5'-nucleotidase family)
LLRSGVQGRNGLLQGFPPNTGVGWYSLATGTWPGEHGSTNNTFHRTGNDFTRRTSAFEPGILQADTIQQAAERAGKTVVSVEWVGSRGLTPALEGPVVDFRSFHSSRGVATNYERESDDATFIGIFGLDYDVDPLAEAAGWSNVPASFSPPLQTVMIVRDFGEPKYDHNVYIYDSTDDATVNYDHALLVRAPSNDGANAAADLTVGAWADIKLTIEGGSDDGGTGGMLVKLEELNDDASQFRLYHTSVSRVTASYVADPDFEETLAANFPTSTAADFAPLEAGIVTEDTYVEQGQMWEDSHFAYLRYILGSGPVPTSDGGTIDGLGVKPHLLMLGTPVTDEFQHQFLGLVTRTDIDGDPNPYFDDLDGDGARDGRLAVRRGYIRSAYVLADRTLRLGRQLMGGRTTTFATSDHGFAPAWQAVNARKVLFDASVDGVSLHASGENAVSNCGADATDLAKACWAGGTIQVYVNPTLPEGTTYDEVRTAVVDAFSALSDPENPGKQVVDEIFLKEELRDVDGTDALHPNRSGDVVVALRPPYQSDAGTPGVPIAFSHFFGQHGYLPGLVDLRDNVNLRATFVASGPGIRDRGPVGRVRAIDLAPTLSFLLRIEGPQNARGRILYSIVDRGRQLRELTILDISDYHGQLPPLSERADSVGPSFAIGGAAFLDQWFDLYEREARNRTITLTAGDAVGATPPISNFFGDRPTIRAMNRMGFDLNGLGNHDFDRGQRYLRRTLIPLARFDYLSANIVDAAGHTPAQWSPSKVIRFAGGRIGFIGFSNPDIPELTFPGALGPFQVTDPVAAVNREAERLAFRGVRTIVALGHMGATSGTLTDPQGPVVDLADSVRNVDVVIGDHTSFQVLDRRPNGVLLVENLSKGIRFTRVRLVVDRATNRLVYKTADFHKPWNIGVEPDRRLQSQIDRLNARLAPVLSGEVGSSTVFIPREDACGNAEGRTCESLVGNVTTDAMRTTYGTDFAITNAGGLRANLTCPTEDNPDDFCPSYTPPPFPITRGQVLSVLPFGNVVVTVTIDGAEVKAFLENGVSAMPAVSGRFAQVSGLCFTYDISAAAGSRVTGAVRQAEDGSCTGEAIDLTASSTYTLAINDFMASGGDGYPVVASRATTRDIMDEVLADYIAANTPISPAIQGRIVCTGASCPTITGP